MNGLGRGISNAPAWMTREQNNNSLGNSGGFGMGGGDGLPPMMMGKDYDDFGRAQRHSPGQKFSNQQMPRPNHHDRRRNSHDDRRHGPSNDADRWEGRGNGGPPPNARRRGSGRDRDRHRDDRDNRGGRIDNINSSSSREQLGLIVFRSYDEEQDWIDERRRKRKSCPSKFDVPPTPQQIAADAAVKAISNPGATDFAGVLKTRDFSAVPQQTRHARRLYIGHLPPNAHEQELHDFFRTSIEQAMTSDNNDDNQVDPVLSVYINHERRFCFLEFREVGMATACMALDGININGKGKVKVKRPNDYNPTMAPTVHPSSVPVLDVSRLGIISSNVQDGPNKVFIGGLHYHLTESQVLELVGAFGKIKAFHLVKNEPDSPTSKGYCFVEYADPNSTPVAAMGLNGMDMGGGKVLTARIAGQRGPPTSALLDGSTGAAGQQFPPQLLNVTGATIVQGYDIEALVDAAMGLKPMPTAPTHVEHFGSPIAQMGSGIMAALPPPPPPPQQPRMPPGTGLAGAPSMEVTLVPSPQSSVTAAALPPGSSALDIANAAQAALDAAFGTGGTVQQSNVPPPPPPQQTKTRILVLLNMVSDEDLKTDEEYSGLIEEVEEEVRKFGKLLSMQIPRKSTLTIEASAFGKIFLEYATTQDSANAEQELAGRQFGPNVVEASYYNEQEYASLKLR